MEYMAERLRRDHLAHLRPFPQQGDREVADSRLHKMVLMGELAHNGNPRLAEHVENAARRVQPDQDSTMRAIKKAPDRKIDLVVAPSMAVHRIMVGNA